MPVWSWVLIWSVLVAALVVVLVVGTRFVIRRSRPVRRELAALTDNLAALQEAIDGLETEPEARRSAFSTDRADLLGRVETDRMSRARRRQARRDARIARGRLITHSAENWTPPHA